MKAGPGQAAARSPGADPATCFPSPLALMAPGCSTVRAASGGGSQCQQLLPPPAGEPGRAPGGPSVPGVELEPLGDGSSTTS